MDRDGVALIVDGLGLRGDCVAKAGANGRNTVAELVCGGQRYVVKIRRDPRDDARREAWALRLLQTPALVASSTVRAIAGRLVDAGRTTEVIDAELDGGGVVVTERVAGEQRWPAGDDVAAAAAALLRLHGVKPHDVDKPVIGGATVPAAIGYTRLCVDTLRRRDALSAKDARTILEHAAWAQALLSSNIAAFAGMERVLCHGDPWIANVVFNAGGAVWIDLEHAGLGDPAIDLARLAHNMRLSIDDEHALLDAYCGAGGDIAVVDRYVVAREIVPYASSLGTLVARSTIGERRTRRTRGVVVAIDGAAGSGKTPIAAQVARALGVPHINTGAVYRAAALVAIERGIDRVDELVRVLDVAPTNDGAATIRGKRVAAVLDTLPVEQSVARWAAQQPLRGALAPIFAKALLGGVVVEGRDAATAVVPHCDYAFFVDADADAVADNGAARAGADVERFARAFEERDRIDAARLDAARRRKGVVRVAGDADAVETILARVR